MKAVAHRLAKLEAAHLRAGPDASASMIEAAEQAWREAWMKAEAEMRGETEDGASSDTRAGALLALHADLTREAVAAEARRAARLAKR